MKHIVHPRTTSPNDLSLCRIKRKKREGEKTIVKLNRLGQTVATIFNNRAAYVQGLGDAGRKFRYRLNRGGPVEMSGTQREHSCRRGGIEGAIISWRHVPGPRVPEQMAKALWMHLANALRATAFVNGGPTGFHGTKTRSAGVVAPRLSVTIDQRDKVVGEMYRVGRLTYYSFWNRDCTQEFLILFD